MRIASGTTNHCTWSLFALSLDSQPLALRQRNQNFNFAILGASGACPSKDTQLKYPLLLIRMESV